MAKKLLVADDSQTIRQAFEMTFAGDAGIEVFGAGDASSAISKAREIVPDLVVVDSRLGDATGYDVCKQLKGDVIFSSVQIWILTGPAERIDEEMYANCKADGHVRKPWDTQRMIDKVAAMSAPLEEEMARPSYPPAAAKPAAPPAAAPKPQIAAPKPPEQRARQSTLMGSPPIKPAVAPRPAVPAPQAAAKPAAPAPRPAARPAGSEVEAADLRSQAGRAALDGLTPEQREAVMALLREVVEKTVWEVVPDMAEAIIREEIARLLKE